MSKNINVELSSIKLVKANINNAKELHEMQVKTFKPLLEKYRDLSTNPANEKMERTISRINQPFTDYFLIRYNEINIGGIRIIRKGNRAYRLGPIFILPEFQGKGFAQTVFDLIEEIYDDAVVWDLDTILEEKGNCYLYEKMGYKKTGKTEKISNIMTIVFYEKKIDKDL